MKNSTLDITKPSIREKQHFNKAKKSCLLGLAAPHTHNQPKQIRLKVVQVVEVST